MPSSLFPSCSWTINNSSCLYWSLPLGKLPQSLSHMHYLIWKSSPGRKQAYITTEFLKCWKWGSERYYALSKGNSWTGEGNVVSTTLLVHFPSVHICLKVRPASFFLEQVSLKNSKNSVLNCCRDVGCLSGCLLQRLNPC